MAIERDGSVRAHKPTRGPYKGVFLAQYKYKGQWHNVLQNGNCATYADPLDARSAAIKHYRTLPKLADAAHLAFLPTPFLAGMASVNKRDFAHVHPRSSRELAYRKACNLAGHMAVAQFHTQAMNANSQAIKRAADAGINALGI